MELLWKHSKNVVLPQVAVWKVEFRIYEGITPREEMSCFFSIFLKVLKAFFSHFFHPLRCFGKWLNMTMLLFIQMRKPRYGSMIFLSKSPSLMRVMEDKWLYLWSYVNTLRSMCLHKTREYSYSFLRKGRSTFSGRVSRKRYFGILTTSKRRKTQVI